MIPAILRRRGSFIRELCVATEHRWEPQRLFVIFTAYFDESGTHDDSPALTLGALLGTARQWELIERRLKRMRREYGFSVFHAKEFKAKSGEFQGWSDQKRFLLLSELTDVVKHGLAATISVTLEKERYLKEYREAPRHKKMPLDSQFGVCFRHVISHLIRKLEADGKSHRLNVILESGHKNVGGAVKIFDEIKAELETDFGIDLLGIMSIARKQDSLPLMVADFMAHMAFARDRELRSGLAPPPRADPPKFAKNETPWTAITLSPTAFDSWRAQFQEGLRRKAQKRREGKR